MILIIIHYLYLNNRNIDEFKNHLNKNQTHKIKIDTLIVTNKDKAFHIKHKLA